jgi:hypothetical protein
VKLEGWDGTDRMEGDINAEFWFRHLVERDQYGDQDIDLEIIILIFRL